MVKIFFTFLFAVAVFCAGFFAGVLKVSRPFVNAEEILQVSRLPSNLRAAETIGRLYKEMTPASNMLKKRLVMMQLCRNETLLKELQAVSIESALQKITKKILSEIENGNLPDRESAVFAFSGVFTAWLFNVNTPVSNEEAEELIRSGQVEINRDACTEAAEDARLLIERVKFVSRN